MHRNPFTLDRPTLRFGILGLAGAMLLSTAALAADAPASPAGRGSWQTHKYSFQFLGFTSTYSCDGLADKLKELCSPRAPARTPSLSREPVRLRSAGRTSSRAPTSPSRPGSPRHAAAANLKSVNGTWRQCAGNGPIKGVPG